MNDQDKKRIAIGRSFVRRYLNQHGSVKVRDINEFVTKMNKNMVSEEYLKICRRSAAMFEDDDCE